jgi:UDPglucose 6-dehydrogenase
LKISVIGSGHVGLTTAACLAFCGHYTTVIDVDSERIETLSRGSLPFFEAGLQELLERARPCLHFTTDFSAASEVEVCLLAVPSPTDESGRVDLSFMRTALTELGRGLSLRGRQEPLLVVNKCTVPVGTVAMAAEWVNTQIEEDLIKASSSEPPQPRFTLSSAPEFLREGRAVRDTLYPDRLVFGVESERYGRILRDLYAPILERSFPELDLGEAAPSSLPGLIVTSVKTAELIKYAANTFLATKLSFINEMGTLTSALGISIKDVADGMGLDHRIGRGFLDAGIGWGGSCLGKDIQALIGTAREYGLPTPLLEAAMEVNERQRGVVTRLLQEELHILRGSRIGLLGLAFKPGTDDLRDAPSLDIAGRLLALGASVSGYDPVVRQVSLRGVKVQTSVAAVASGSDALVLVTEWEEFRDLPWSDLAASMRHAVFIDGRNMMPPSQLQDAGFRYRGIGR